MSRRPDQPESSFDAARDAAQRSRKVVTVLSVSASEADHRALGHVFRHTNWTLLEARTCNEAVEVLNREPVPVVICDHSLPDGRWTDILEKLPQLPAQPVLIVSSRLADDSLWAEVMGSGGYDVLEKPFNQSELVRVVSLAWLAWKDRSARVARTGGTSAANES
jgi:DNA-binding response OmpR family regulator